MRTKRSWGLVLLLAPLGACGGGGGARATTAAISGTIVFQSGLPPLGAVIESEPNDSPDTAHELGALTAGETIVVHGRTSSVADVDPFDGFHLLAPQRVRVTVTLEFDAEGNDFDIGVFELGTFQFVEVFLAATAPETGVFHAKGSFDVIVAAYAGEGDYVLTISAAAPSSPIAEREVNDAFAVGQWLGDVVTRDFVSVSGTAHYVSDPHEVLFVSCPEQVELRCVLAFPSGADYDFAVYDASTDLLNPDLAAAFDQAAPSPEVGTVTADAGSLLAFHVFAYAGSGPWTLSIAGENPSFAISKARVDLPPRLAPLSAEKTRWKGGGPLAHYGEPRREFVPGEVLVGWRDGEAPDAEALARRGGGVVRDAVPGTGARLSLPLPAGASETECARCTLARLSALRSHPGVAFAEVNGVRHAAAEPNDTYYNLQWHYPLIHLPEAWDVTTGSATTIVAVIDTGKTDHPDLAGRLVAGYDFISDPDSAGDGDGVDADPTDVGDGWGPGTNSWHGTHVAGTIGASTDNGMGVAGVTWQSQVMPLRALGKFGGTDWDIANAIRYAARLPNSTGMLPLLRANVINMSLGGPGPSQVMQDACTAARNAGVIVVAAAGNSSSSELFVPAGLDGVISVSAVDARAELTTYSNFGPLVDIAAPGGSYLDLTGDGYPDGVLSTWLDDTVTPYEPVYLFNQGTSMAAPHVAGVIALMLAEDPLLTPDQVDALLAGSAEDLGAPGRDDRYGWGLVNAHRAVLAAQGSTFNTPSLSVTPTTVNLGDGGTTADLRISNAGGGFLSVGAPTVTTQSGQAWLSAALLGPSDAARSARTLRIAGDRTGLAEGSYSGRAIVTSNGGTVEVQVLMTVVNTPPSPPDVNVYVFALDSATRAIVAEVIVNPAGSLDFEFPSLPPGEYEIFASSDEDHDGAILEEGEWAGAWPIRSDPGTISVAVGDVVTGVDFTVAPTSGISASPMAR